MTDIIEQRKVDHLTLCSREEVEFRLKTTLFEQVHLVHNAFPELDADSLDTSTELLGVHLRAPIVITGMTGGAEPARRINETLAQVAQAQGVAFGVGSQRAMLRDPGLLSTYAVRSIAPDILLLGNIGAVQARDATTDEIESLVGAIDANALCVHLNPAQEMIQAEGDRDFRGCVEAIGRLAEELSVPVVLKETGCGLGPAVIDAAHAMGVTTFDLSGAGGTTWVGVEALRAKPDRRGVGEDFWDWGIPTAAAIATAAARPGIDVIDIIASGGVRSGHDVARAIALGATAAGMALPLLRAIHVDGLEGAMRALRQVIDGLRVAMVLTGSANLGALRRSPRVLGADLNRWVEALQG